MQIMHLIVLRNSAGDICSLGTICELLLYIKSNTFLCIWRFLSSACSAHRNTSTQWDERNNMYQLKSSKSGTHMTRVTEDGCQIILFLDIFFMLLWRVQTKSCQLIIRVRLKQNTVAAIKSAETRIQHRNKTTVGIGSLAWAYSLTKEARG